MIVVFPAPVAPTRATDRPGATSKLTSRSVQPSSAGAAAAAAAGEAAGAPPAYVNQTSSNATRPSTAAGRAAAGGLTTSAFVSRRPKMRSDEAIAACSTLNFSERSEIGRQNRSEYWMKATRTPMVSAPERTSAPPRSRMSAIARAARSSIAG